MPRRRQRRSHLAEAINRSSPGVRLFWQIVIAIAMVVSVGIAVFK